MANIGSPRAEVGEIDTRQPFESVKAALNLFVDASPPNKLLDRPSFRKKLSENVIDKVTQLMLAQRDLNKLKQQLESAEVTRSHAVSELERAERTLHDLTAKLKAVTDSKTSAIVEAEAVKELAKRLEVEKSEKAIGNEAWKRELEQTRGEYVAVFAELDLSKQELNKMRQDFDSTLEAKLAAFQLANSAQRSAGTGEGKSVEISAEIALVKASVEEMNAAARQARLERDKIGAERDSRLEARKAAREEAEAELDRLRSEIVDPEVKRGLEAEFEKASKEIEAVREEMRQAHEADMEIARMLTEELNEATKRLQEVGREESSLRSLVNSLEKELEFEVGNERRFVLQRLTEEVERARREQEEVMKSVVRTRKENEDSRTATETTERKLHEVLAEAEEAKAKERKALDEMKGYDSGESFAKLTLSVAEFDALTRKVEEAQNAAELKEAESAAVLQGINARRVEVDKKLEANLKAVEEIKTATDLALRKAEMSESAKTIVESELQKWHHDEHRPVQVKT